MRINKRWFRIFSLWCLGWGCLSGAQAAEEKLPDAFNVVWHTPSDNAAGSMPCGGGDMGLNVWVEQGDLLVYVSRSGAFDEHNCLLKQGRLRLRLSPNPFVDASDFRQELKLNEGLVEISAGGTVVQVWTDVYAPVAHIEVSSRQKVSAQLFYENWRYRDRLIRKGEGQQHSYKWAPPKGTVTSADSVRADLHELLFMHRNPEQTVFDVCVSQQGLESVKEQLVNPLKNLTSGGLLHAEGMTYAGVHSGVYGGTDYRAWEYKTARPVKSFAVQMKVHIAQTATVAEWERGLRTIQPGAIKKQRERTRQWWRAFWQRSFIAGTGASEAITRNYTLFRYLLGCNAYGSYPTKFNGGLFTFDPVWVDEKQAFTPDYRKWGGGTMTAQNQRLVYWPMLKSGDFDLMTAQFETYLRMLPNAELRSRVYWGHDGGCFSEQIENFGLPNPAEYGFKRPDYFDRGVEYNAWLEYEWDTVLEFCAMILERSRYDGSDISRYEPLIRSALTFFDEHYRYLAKRRGRKALDGEGKLILFPGSACETYKMTLNASSTVAALRRVLDLYGRMDSLKSVIPSVPLYIKGGRTMIAPAKSWERINNIETPQLYPVFPWRLYGVGRDDLEIARNTYLYDDHAVKQHTHIGWKQDPIWAACLGLTEEAGRLVQAKLKDGPHRFPAFWGPGYDWTPDHNWGGSGMIALQEMLLQTVDDRILLFPAWPKEWDVHFKLHAEQYTVVEATLKNGKVTQLNVWPEERRKDVECLIDKTLK